MIHALSFSGTAKGMHHDSCHLPAELLTEMITLTSVICPRRVSAPPHALHVCREDIIRTFDTTAVPGETLGFLFGKVVKVSRPLSPSRSSLPGVSSDNMLMHILYSHPEPFKCYITPRSKHAEEQSR